MLRSRAITKSGPTLNSTTTAGESAVSASEQALTVTRESTAEARSLLILLGLFVLMAIFWAATIQVPAASVDAAKWDGFNPDEQVHMKYVAFLATHFRLPDPWSGTPPTGGGIYTAVHPPLYYAFAAIFYLLSAPLFGYHAAVMVLRVVGALIGAGVVYMTYKTARKLFAHDISLLAATIVAGVPMFVSLSGSVTNEIAGAFAASGALWMLTCGFVDGFDRRRVLLIAVWVGAGIAIKMTDLALLPTVILGIFIAPRSVKADGLHGLGSRLRSAAIVILGPLISVGWWMVRNVILYHDPLQSRQHNAYWGATVQHPWWTLMNVPEFFRNGSLLGWESFWGIFDAFGRPMPDYAYLAVFALQVPAFIGFVAFMGTGRLRGRVLWRVALTFALFESLVLAIFYAVNWRIYCPQGRYVFPLLTPFGIATAVGWTMLWSPKWRYIPIGIAMVILLFLNIFALVVMPVRPLAP